MKTSFYDTSSFTHIQKKYYFLVVIGVVFVTFVIISKSLVGNYASRMPAWLHPSHSLIKKIAVISPGPRSARPASGK